MNKLITEMYKLFFGGALVILGICLLSIVVLLSQLEQVMGHGGSALAALVIGICFLGFVVITVSSWIAAAISYIWDDLLPSKRFYSYWGPLVLSAPGTAYFVVNLVMYVRESYI